LHKNAARRPNLVYDTALLLVRRLWEEDFSIERPIWLFLAMPRFAIILRPDFRKVCKLARDSFTNFDPLLDPFQGFG
jgi:hypothetical protein